MKWWAKFNPETAHRSTKALGDSLGMEGTDYVSDEPHKLRSAYRFAARVWTIYLLRNDYEMVPPDHSEPCAKSLYLMSSVHRYTLSMDRSRLFSS